MTTSAPSDFPAWLSAAVALREARDLWHARYKANGGKVDPSDTEMASATRASNAAQEVLKAVDLADPSVPKTVKEFASTWTGFSRAVQAEREGDLASRFLIGVLISEHTRLGHVIENEADAWVVSHLAREDAA